MTFAGIKNQQEINDLGPIKQFDAEGNIEVDRLAEAETSMVEECHRTAQPNRPAPAIRLSYRLLQTCSH